VTTKSLFASRSNRNPTPAHKMKELGVKMTHTSNKEMYWQHKQDRHQQQGQGEGG
jgi:hypothetical protein